MTWLQRFLGLNDKEQMKKTHEVTTMVEKRRKLFNSDLKKLKKQAEVVREQSSKTTRESVKLVLMVTDVTSRIAAVSGNIEDE